MTTPATALSLSGTKFFANKNGNNRQLYFGLRLTLTGIFDSVLAINDFLQDVYYDDLGASGYYWIMPESYKDAITADFNNTIATDQSAAVQFNKDNTVVELLLRVEDYECIDEERAAIGEELALLINQGYATQYEQFCLY